MLKFVKEDGIEIFVNPSQVLCVAQSGKPGVAEIHFVAQQYFVRGGAAEVSAQIAAALPKS